MAKVVFIFILFFSSSIAFSQNVFFAEGLRRYDFPTLPENTIQIGRATIFTFFDHQFYDDLPNLVLFSDSTDFRKLKVEGGKVYYLRQHKGMVIYPTNKDIIISYFDDSIGVTEKFEVLEKVSPHVDLKFEEKVVASHDKVKLIDLDSYLTYNVSYPSKFFYSFPSISFKYKQTNFELTLIRGKSIVKKVISEYDFIELRSFLKRASPEDKLQINLYLQSIDERGKERYLFCTKLFYLTIKGEREDNL